MVNKRTGSVARLFSITGTNIYLAAFSIYFLSAMSAYTMFSYTIPSIVGTGVRAITLGLILIKLVFLDKFTSKELLIDTLLGGTVLATAYSAHTITIIFVYFLIIGAKDVPFLKIIKTYLWTGGTLLGYTVVSALLEIIPNLIFYRDGGRPRVSFGMIYPTNFAACVFFLVLAYCYLRHDKMNRFDYIGIMIIGSIVYIFTDARLDVITIILLLVALGIYQKRTVLKNKYHLIIRLSVYIIPAAALFSLITSYLYHPTNFITGKLNSILSGRLNHAKDAFNNYPINLFGHDIPQTGWGGFRGYYGGQNFHYFFIDCSYVRVLLMYGLIMFAWVIIGYVLVAKRYLRHNDSLFVLMIALVAISSIVDANLIEAATNPFMFAFLAKTSAWNDGLIRESSVNELRN
jgi:hypothetical protein